MAHYLTYLLSGLYFSKNEMEKKRIISLKIDRKER